MAKLKLRFPYKRLRRVTFQLVGGLGNQLFGFYAGLSVASAQNIEIRFDVSQFDKGFTSHGSDIQSFDLNYQFHRPGPVERTFRNICRVLESEKFVPYHLRGLAGRISPQYTSGVDGFDGNVFESLPGSHVRGYFQSYVYLEKIKAAGIFQPLKLKSESDWFKTMCALMVAEMPVSIHLRRGDYRLLAEVYGLLSSDYYVAALREMKAHLDSSFNVWVFSDDPGAAKSELGAALSQCPEVKNVRWIEQPVGTDPAESLMLMAHAAGNIISNSTFAWWGAALNQGSKPVIAPKKWFRGKEDPEMLYPRHWHLMDSSWL